MEEIPQKSDNPGGNINQKSMKIMGWMSDGLISKNDINDAISELGETEITEKVIDKIIEKHGNITNSMEKDAQIADIEHRGKLGKDY